jgi:PAS domain S-box-containing protein
VRDGNTSSTGVVGARSPSEAGPLGAWRALLEATSDAVFSVDPEWIEVRELRGHAVPTPRAGPPRGWLDRFVPAEDQGSFRAALAAAAREKRMLAVEHRLLGPGGDVRRVLTRAVPLLDPAQAITGWLGAWTEIAGGRETQRALHRASAEVEALYAQVPVGILQLDTELRYVRINERLAAMNGAPAAAHIGRTIHEMVPELAPKLEPAFREILRTGVPVFEVEVTGETAAAPGVEHTWLESWFPVRDAAGAVCGITVVAQDITERAAAHAAAERDRFRVRLGDALRLVPDPREVQRAASRLLGEHLAASRVGYFEVEADEYVSGAVYAHGVAQPEERYPVAAFGTRLLSLYRRGENAVATDVARDPELGERERATLLALNIQAYIGIPLLKAGQFVAGLAVHQNMPRRWQPEEIALVQEVAERTWAAVERARAQGALQKSEERYRTLFEAIDEGFCIVEVSFNPSGTPVDYRFLEANPAFEQLTGLVGALGRTARELVPDLEPFWFETYGQVALTGRPTRFENHSVPMGRWFDVHASRVGDASSRRVAIVFTNITDRKNAERALRDSEAQLSAATAAGAVGTWHYDLTKNIVTANPAFARLFGLEPEAAARGVSVERYLAAIHPEDLPAVQTAIDRAIATRQPFEAEYRVRKGQAEWRWVVARGRVEYAADGTPLRFPGALTDITERKAAEAAYRASELRFRQLADAMPQIVWTSDPDGAVDYCNRQWQEVTGLAAPLGHRASAAALHPEDVARVEAKWEGARASGGIFEAELRLKHAGSGGYRWFLTRATPVRDTAGRIVKWFGTSTDIHDQKNTAEYLARMVEERTLLLREKIAELEAFSYSVSHDMRGPLRSMQGFAHLLDEEYGERLDDVGRDYLRRIERGAQRLDLLVRDVLAYSKLAKSEVQLQPVALASFLRDLVQAPELQAATIRLQEPLPRVAGHPALLSQIFANLFGNAVKFGRPGVPVEIRVWGEPRGERARIWVEDNGIGIAPEHYPRIFEIFGRVYADRLYEGTGIGLAIVKKAAERLGGRVGVESELGRGSRFWVELAPA